MPPTKFIDLTVIGKTVYTERDGFLVPLGAERTNMSSNAPKRIRLLPHRNRQHVLRKILQPRSMATSSVGVQPQTSSTQSTSPAKPFPFLDLPGELKNKIYDLVIPTTRVVVTGSHPKKDLETLKWMFPNKEHKTRVRLLGEVTGDTERASMALLLTCRQMNEEVVTFIYSRTTFCFDRMAILNKFLNVIPGAAAKSIGKLEITHVGYGEPQWIRDREWKLRHDEKWAKTLKRLQQEMTSLTTLVLDLTLFDWPCRLEIDESWAKPLLDLAEDGLERVNVKLVHDRFDPNKAAAIAKELENKMMSTDGKQKKLHEAEAKAAMEKKQREAARTKALKSLKIRMPLGDKTMAKNVPAKRVVKTQGLEQFAKAEPGVAYCG
ncbi:hypothetical protein KCU88_g2923, partial [Aureobasidium melanogenum]